MNDRLIIIAAIVFIAVVGLVTLIAARYRLTRKRQLVNEFGDRFAEFGHSGGNDSEIYAWLILNSGRMQSAMGEHGIYGHFRPPFANYAIPNYPIILNLVPEYRKAALDSILSRNLAGQYYDAVAESLLRHTGAIEQRTALLNADLRNPLTWLREGVRWLFSLPIALLGWVGLMSAARVERLSRSALVRVLSAIGTLIGLLSSIMGLVLGWADFYQWISKLIQQLL